MKLENIGFYTLNDDRASTACHTSKLSRCELVLTARCNFRCPYCRSVGGEDLPFGEATSLVRMWAADGLRNIRFSGGEPTLYDGLPYLCRLAKSLGAEHVAVSTNGSASIDVYRGLLSSGVNDFSVSLDACCAEDGDRMAGGVKGAFDTVTKSIKWLAARTYVTVGVVLTEANVGTVNDIISFADSLGVSDIRVIPAAQDGDRLSGVFVAAEMLAKYPILNYRITNIQAGRPVRGLREGDPIRCGLVLDDMAVNQGNHYPCIIYMRESGRAIGNVGDNMRTERREWYESHNVHNDPICKGNCLDVCVDYNRRFAATNPANKP
jgi:MoaA/NifB/PqqE/SkfB family radical SAM enzyme